MRFCWCWICLVLYSGASFPRAAEYTDLRHPLYTRRWEIPRIESSFIGATVVYCVHPSTVCLQRTLAGSPKLFHSAAAAFERAARCCQKSRTCFIGKKFEEEENHITITIHIEKRLLCIEVPRGDPFIQKEKNNMYLLYDGVSGFFFFHNAWALPTHL